MGTDPADVGISALQRRAEGVYRAAVRAHGSRVYDGPVDAAVCTGGQQGRQAVDGECGPYGLQFERDEGCPDAGWMRLGGFWKEARSGLSGGGKGVYW